MDRKKNKKLCGSSSGFTDHSGDQVVVSVSTRPVQQVHYFQLAHVCGLFVMDRGTSRLKYSAIDQQPPDPACLGSLMSSGRLMFVALAASRATTPSCCGGEGEPASQSPPSLDEWFGVNTPGLQRVRERVLCIFGPGFQCEGL